MDYLEASRRRVRYVPAVIATLAINGWLAYALLHGNIFPFAKPEHLIHVLIYPAAPTSK